jgi:hemolysin-activating ACP:hemolysin acyltransferase
MQTSTTVDADLPAGTLRLIQPKNPVFALGLAVRYLITKPAFAQLPFGHWSRILIGQINRGHYRFVVDDANRVQGFLGWALANKQNAVAWLEGRRGLSDAEAKEGDSLIINVWSSNNSHANRLMLAEIRRIGKDKDTVYFKRHYADGAIRPGRIKVNEFVGHHLNGSQFELAAEIPSSETISN